MAEYKVVIRRDEATTGVDALVWERGCPLFVEAVQVSRDTETGRAFLQIRVRNVSSEVAQSFELDVQVRFERGGEQDILVNPLDADIRPGESKPLEPVRLDQGDVAFLDYKIISVKGVGRSWRTEDEAQALPDLPSLDLDDVCLEERRILLYGTREDRRSRQATGRGHVEYDDWWICSCGIPNVSTDSCVGCGLAKERLTQTESRAFLEASAAQRKKAAEAKSAKQKKIAKRAAIAVGAVAVVVTAAVLINNFVIVPAQLRSRYEAAVASYDEGNYDLAAQEFKMLGDYEDSKERRQQAKEKAVEAKEKSAQEKEKAKEEAAFYNSYVSKRKTAFYFPRESESETTRGRELKFFLGKDGTCSATIPASGWGGSFADYQGEWEGTWDYESRKLTLPGFPGGESWEIAGAEKVKNYSEEVLVVKSQDSLHSFYIHSSEHSSL